MTVIIDPANPKIKISSLNAGLVGHWRLDKESFSPGTKRFTDRSAFCNHGTGNGTQLGSADPGFQADRMGQLVRAAPFNGSDDYIDCGTKDALNTGGKISIRLLLYSTEAKQSSCIHSASTNSYSDFSYLLRIEANNIISIINGDGVNWSFKQSAHPILEQNAWVNLLVTIDGINAKIYKSGVLDSTLVLDYTLTDIPGARTIIGCDPAITDWFFKGNVADIRVYDRILSSAERNLLNEVYRV